MGKIFQAEALRAQAGCSGCGDDLLMPSQEFVSLILWSLILIVSYSGKGWTTPVSLLAACTAAIFTPSGTGIPLSLTHHLKQNQVLHERMLLMSTLAPNPPPRTAARPHGPRPDDGTRVRPVLTTAPARPSAERHTETTRTCRPPNR